jgi:hypothetical protein
MQRRGSGSSRFEQVGRKQRAACRVLWWNASSAAPYACFISPTIDHVSCISTCDKFPRTFQSADLESKVGSCGNVKRARDHTKQRCILCCVQRAAVSQLGSHCCALSRSARVRTHWFCSTALVLPCDSNCSQLPTTWPSNLCPPVECPTHLAVELMELLEVLQAIAVCLYPAVSVAETVQLQPVWEGAGAQVRPWSWCTEHHRPSHDSQLASRRRRTSSTTSCMGLQGSSCACTFLPCTCLQQCGGVC